MLICSPSPFTKNL